MQEQFLLFFQNYQYPVLLLNLTGETIFFNPAAGRYFPKLQTCGTLDAVYKNFFVSVAQIVLIKKSLTIKREVLGSFGLFKFNLINNQPEPIIMLLIEPEISSSKNLAWQDSDIFVQAFIHEIKAHLVTILGFSSALKEDYFQHLQEEGIDFLKSIEHSAKTLDEKLIVLTELIEVSKQIKDKELTDFKEVLQNACRMLKSVIEKRNPHIVTVTDLPIVNCNKNLMVKVMVNLMSNAIKFTPQNRQPVIEIGCKKQKSIYQFWIADQGIGINVNFYKKIFEPFFQIKEIQKASGIGLGLTLVERIIHAHNGKLKIESVSGKGSCFYFSLPFRNIS